MDPKLVVHQIQNVVGVHQMGCAIYELLPHLVDRVIYKQRHVLEYVQPFPIADHVQHMEIRKFLQTKQNFQYVKTVLKIYQVVLSIFFDYANVHGVHLWINATPSTNLQIDAFQEITMYIPIRHLSTLTAIWYQNLGEKAFTK